MNRNGGTRWLAGMMRDLLALLSCTRVEVTGQSMEPALRQGDRLLIRRLWPVFEPIRRGEVVFLRGRAGISPECIKRIVGLPHERVRLAAGSVLVNGCPLDEPYLVHSAGEAGRELRHQLLAAEPEREWRLAPDEYLVLGDNRLHSSDSRSYGPVHRRDIVGVACYRYAPPQRRGWLGR